MTVKHPLDPQCQWFPEARFGMFVHFGLYALLGRGEWVMYHEQIPRAEYVPLMRRFNPRRFCADEWVDAAERAGCRYLTVTAKHHDGFCLFDSALTDFKITNTPFRRDLIGELIEACQRRGMRICLYYSQPDWHHPAYVHRPGAFKDLQYQNPGDAPDWPAFVEYYLGQVEELCTRYGRIDGIWFDGVQRTEAQWQGRRVYELIKRHQPHAVVNDRAGYGDFYTPERNLAVRPSAAGYMVEACQSVAHGAWGFQKDAVLYSSPHLLQSCLRMFGAGGNYLLNVGPRPDGSLPADWLQRLNDIGDWLGVHGRAVYGAEGCPLRAESENLVYTRQGRKLYAHLLQWPDDNQVILRQLAAVPTRARLLATGAKLRVQAEQGTVTVRDLPSLPPHPAANVIELTFATDRLFAPLPAAPRPPVVTVGPGPCALTPDTAVLRGFGIKGSVLAPQTLPDGSQTFPAGWVPDVKAEWLLECAQAGRYRVSFEVACTAPHEGSVLQVQAAGQKVRGEVPDTGGFGNYVEVQMGELDLSAGQTKLTAAPVKMHYAYCLGNVRRVWLKPV
jgi:alpha-L-fucosidase